MQIHPKNAILLTVISVIVLMCSYSSCLAAPHVLKTAFQRSYPKYYQTESFDSKKFEGLCIDILHAIEKTSGLQIQSPHNFLPFKRLQARLESGAIDLFIGMAKNEARLKKYIFVDTPLYEVNQIVVLRRTDTVEIHNLDDIRNLAPDNIILTNYGTATERQLKAQKELNVDSEGLNIAANLKKLLYGRGRFIYFHDIGLLGAIKRNGYEKEIRVLPIIFKTYHHYVAFAPGTPEEIITRVDQALQKLKASGELARIRARYVHSIL